MFNVEFSSLKTLRAKVSEKNTNVTPLSAVAYHSRAYNKKYLNVMLKRNAMEV